MCCSVGIERTSGQAAPAYAAAATVERPPRGGPRPRPRACCALLRLRLRLEPARGTSRPTTTYQVSTYISFNSTSVATRVRTARRWPAGGGGRLREAPSSAARRAATAAEVAEPSNIATSVVAIVNNEVRAGRRDPPVPLELKIHIQRRCNPPCPTQHVRRRRACAAGRRAAGGRRAGAGRGARRSLTDISGSGGGAAMRPTPARSSQPAPAASPRPARRRPPRRRP
ncbi:hypothetical protein MSG28_004876 [Choristoneura fumiferana]|uniref:Uncharacterized protein n=1 Tax=Choristoneura fumiferana TaxID=7141 RepID=A0ACC0K7X4_CHOFU|nr:hypothetical protein MSG28_004876 [Choristoneura fumiferana]